jgi:uncharacterized membrane protein YkvA (DUF1232 family)
MLDRWRAWARRIKIDTYALYLACRDPRTPWHVRLLAAGIVAYAFSPIDLIPDFVPVLGYLDDLLIVPLGIALAIRLLPDAVLADCRERAQGAADRPTSRLAAVVIVAIWLALAVAAGFWLVDTLG